jgi:hypothetical protein
MICPWYNLPINPDEPKVKEDGEWLHLRCSIEQQDGVDLDRSMED